MEFNPYTIPPFLTSLAVLLLGSLVFIKDSRKKTNQAFLIWCLAVFAWLLFFSLSYSLQNEIFISIFGRLAYASVLFIPITFYIFVLHYLNIGKPPVPLSLIYLAYIALFLLILFTNTILIEPRKFFWGYYTNPGHYFALSIYFFIFTTTLTFYILSKGACNPSIPIEEKEKRKYMLLACSIAFLGAVDYLPSWGISIYPFGFIFVLVWCFMMSHMIIKKKFLNIEVVIKKSAVYSVFLTLISLLYILLVFLLEHLINNKMSSFTIRLSAVIVIALLVSPLRNKVQKIVNRWFLKATPEELVEVNVKLMEIASQSEKMKAIGTLAGGLAHEIKNPLTAIKTFAEHLPKKMEDREFLQKFSQIVGSEVDRIDDLVNQILEFAKPGPIKPADFNLNKLLTDTADFLNNTFLKHRIRIKLDLTTTKDLIINADRSRLRQALLNLLLNAVESMPEGGALSVMTRADRRKVHVIISDTGKGIAKKDLPHIFNPFYTQKDTGTGLGLAITHNIIEEHGGKIWIESNIGKGTTVFVELPIRGVSRP